MNDQDKPMPERVIATARRAIAAIRDERPRVHCLTNPVAMTLSANALLALGAVPSMTMDATVVGEFVSGSTSLLVNLGMLDPARKESIPAALPIVRAQAKPWVLDPVKVERSGGRSATALGLLIDKPTVLRANAGEIAALRGLTGMADRQALASRFDTVVVETGEVDLISDGETTIQISNGSPMMDRVTAMGCTLSAVICAFLAVERDPLLAAAAAVLVYDVAGELASEACGGPGSFQIAFLDYLHAIDGDLLGARARIA